MNELITIIVPIYNVQKYVGICLESIISQTYSNIEIILINDGSTDDSYKICKKYAEKDKRIKLITGKNNGVSRARNIGIENATGKYIIFIDSDDWIEKNMIEELYKAINENDADISICGYYINTETEQYSNNKLKKTEVINNKTEMYNGIFCKDLYEGYLWNKLIKRELINTKFNEKIHIQEDTLFLIDTIRNAKKLVYMPQYRLYHYRKRNNSAVFFKYSYKDISKLEAIEEILKLKEKMNLKGVDDLELEYYILARQAKYIMKKEKIEDKKLENKIKQISKKYFWNAFKIGDFKKKVQVFLLLICPYFFCKILDDIKSRKTSF